MKFPLILFLSALLSLNIFAQDDLHKLVDTEHSFAKLAGEKGTKAAFLAFLADDGIVFDPEPANGKKVWSARPESQSLLAWFPNWADVSSNGALGYTTGNWEYHPAGKDSASTGFGEFATVWQRQPDGTYKFVVDLGVSHDKPAASSSEWRSPADTGKELNEKKSSAADATVGFFETAMKQGMNKAYKTYGADDIYMLREGKSPIIGKSAVAGTIKSDKSAIKFNPQTTFVGSADLAYIVNSYTLTHADKTVEKGNFLQVWKLRGGRWQIVLDVFSPVSEKKS
jgi:ketosteroid isomerase-like protein